jgi:Fe-S-cluster formation regulator IscX/YfhJ
LIKKLYEDIAQTYKDIEDRDSTLETKKLGIMELKKKIQELEKFKFVLDYKINELRREVDPRNVKILELNEKATKMKSELKHFNRVNSNLTLIV